MKSIITKYANYRYTATDNDGNRVRVNQDDALDAEQNHDAAAIALCRKMRWDGPLMRGGLKDAGSRVYVFDAHANRVRFNSNFREQDYIHGEKLRRQQLTVGTSYFVSLEDAIAYYATQDTDADSVQQKIADGAIHIGKPEVKAGESLTVVDGGTRYAIVEGR